MRKNNISLYIIYSLIGITCLSGLVLSHITPSYAESANAAVTVSSACTITTTGSSTNTANLIPGGYTEIVSNPIDISCNDNGGYALYAIGYSGDSYDATNHTKLISSLGSDYDIATNTSGSSSYWAMKVTTSGTNAPVIDNSYGSYQVIPDTYTEITHRTTSTVGTSNSITTPTYKISIASGQVADTYNGKVKYTLVHPSNAAAPTPPLVLYDTIASMSKGTQNINALRAAIVAPDETNTISSNSGVYEYNASVFGADSDGVNSNNEKETIYYYRGILDSYGHTGTYGSDGLADAYPNYVILDANGTKDTSDTCWRIVRTTGSGGVKMIYNGKWTGSTCANSSTSANAVSSIYFNRGTTSDTNKYETAGRIAYVGYNYNQDYGYGGSGANESGSVANSTLFSNGNSSGINSSYIKTQVESWYTSNLTAYTSILETSAGYCNDRTTYTGTTTDTLTDSTVPYKTSSAGVAFGAYIRNATTNSQPSLNCPNTTGYDLLTTSNGLTYPIALLTADEAALAGSGYSASTTPYHAKSYLRSGDYFWLLSPHNRNSSGYVIEFALYSNGRLSSYYLNYTYSVRPTISLASGTTTTSGSGTATDPWVVTAP